MSDTQVPTVGRVVQVTDEFPRYAGLVGTVRAVNALGVTFIAPVEYDGTVKAVPTKYVRVR
jgi:hypothetical protein